MMRKVRILRKRIFLIPVDVFIVGLSFCLAHLVRFEGAVPPEFRDSFLTGLAVVLLVKPGVFFVSGFYRRLWRYASIYDVIQVLKAVSIASVISTLLTLTLTYFQGYSRSILFLDWLFLSVLLLVRSLAWRLAREARYGQTDEADRTLILGAGASGRMLLQETRRGPLGMQILGFLDDNPSKAGVSILGAPVLGGISELRQMVGRYRVERVVIALPSQSAKRIRESIFLCRELGVRVQRLPAIEDMLQSGEPAMQVRDVDLEDLLGREPVRIDMDGIRRYITGKRVLVTGAGGSIGSEICRQLAHFDPRKIILFDNAETPLFHIEQELSGAHPRLPLSAVLGDIRFRARVDAIFDEHAPQVVFHAAAFKHVPMLEKNPAEAVNNNVRGTQIVAEAADRTGVEHFVMISTDKAVNPTNVMGASKRVAELAVQSLARRSRTHFVTVRFGNVLGSNGSVIPIFREQIRKGGPVTVTHPDVTRFFMTIPEATQLVLQAGSMGRGGEIFLLDMGEPVKIQTLAEELIRLCGFVPHEDIKIVFTGLRPGEKLFEELLLDGEGVVKTAHEKIRVARSMEVDAAALSKALEALYASARAMDLPAVRAGLQALVPEFSFPGHPRQAKIICHPSVSASNQ